MKKILMALLVAPFIMSAAQADPHNVFGTFLTEEENSHIEIEDCGDGSPCGKVVWLDPTKMDNGVTPAEAKTKAGDPVLGLLMLQGFERKGSDWRNGTIYAPDKDKTYASRLKRLEDGTLQVKGCISFCVRLKYGHLPARLKRSCLWLPARQLPNREDVFHMRA